MRARAEAEEIAGRCEPAAGLSQTSLAAGAAREDGSHRGSWECASSRGSAAVRGRRAGGRSERQCFPRVPVLTWVALPVIAGVGDGQFTSE